MLVAKNGQIVFEKYAGFQAPGRKGQYRSLIPLFTWLLFPKLLQEWLFEIMGGWKTGY